MKVRISFIIVLVVFTLQAQAQLNFFKEDNSPKWGVKDQNNKVLVAPKYDDYQPMVNGFALVKLNGRSDLIDINGKELTGFKYEWLNLFSKDGLAQVKQNGKYGFINKTGKEVIPPSLDYVSYFSEGLANFRQKTGDKHLSGYINTEGKIIIAPKYEIAREHVNGFAHVKLNGKYGFIDKLGKEITALKYDYVGIFNEGLAAVVSAGKGGYINTSGQEVIPLIYDEIWDFKYGKAEVRIAGRKFFIDKNGNDLSQPVKVIQPMEVDNGTADFNKGYAAYQTKNYTETLNWYKKAIDKGNVTALFNTGVMYAKGEGVTQNHIEAISWFKKAANKDYVNAMYYLGDIYYKGTGVPKNNEEAFLWFKKAAENGKVDAMHNVAAMYYNGQGISKNEAEAKIWLQKAADNGNESAKKLLQQMQTKSSNGNTELSKGFAAYQAKNYTEALKLYTEAANLGNNRAMYNIGLMYYKGEGVTLNYTEALRWFKKSADMGYADSMYSVGMMNEYGLGIYRNDEEAKVWYNKAADAGNEKAKEKLSSISKRVATIIKTVPPPPTPIKPIINKNVSWLGKNGLYGISDRNGKIIIQPQYDNAFGFNKNGISIATKNNKKGLINNNGKELTPFEYDSDLGYDEGTFLLRKKKPLPNNSLNVETYLIDETGKIILTDVGKPYKLESHLYSGRAMIKTSDGYGYVDKNGKMVIPAVYDASSLFGSSPYWFKDGIAIVRKKDGKMTIIDINGKELTTKGYVSIGGNTSLFTRNPWEGIFTHNTALSKYGYLDKSGKELTPAIYNSVSPFQEGRGKVCMGTTTFKQGFVDKTGKEVIPLTFDVVNDFSEGLAAVVLQNKWGFVDLTGKVVITPQFQNAGQFSEGLAAVSVKDNDGITKRGYINKKGEWVIAPQYWQNTTDFVEGLAGVLINNKWGFINTSGKIVIEPKYDRYSFTDFDDGIKHLETGEYRLGNIKFFYIDKTGKEFKEQ